MEDTDLYLSDMERLELRALEAEAKLVQFESRALMTQRLEYLLKIDPDGKLAAMDRDIQSLNQQLQQKKQEYASTLKKVERRLGINMVEYSFDDETGLLHPA